MSGLYKHLTLTKERLINDRRTTRINFPAPPERELPQHSRRLRQSLSQARTQLSQNHSSSPNRFIFKFSYAGSMDLNRLDKHGVEFVSQEGKQACIVFADEAGLTTFEEHLSRLAVDDAELTYKKILEALEGIDNWTADDRKSWAVSQKGFPDETSFKLDIELWPIAQQSNPLRQSMCSEFEAWLLEHSIRQIDRINQDSLLIYRLEVTAAQAEMLLNHTDVRLVDLLPESGIGYAQLNVDINTIPQDIPAPASDSARVCILDSGMNTNHPMLKSAIGESCSFISGQDEFDDAGHGTAVAGITLYGDVASCVESNYWQPAFWLYNGKILYKDMNTEEVRFDEKTIETTLVEAVSYFSDLGCKIFNLSIGNANAPYDGRHVRGMAYILDKLAREFDVLFVVSAGNFSGSDEPPLPLDSWRDEYPEYLMDSLSAIIDPAPALNVLTVGSLAKHNATRNALRRPDDVSELSPASEDQPSPFTRHGPSVKGALKPDLVATGGSLASPLRPEGRQWDQTVQGLGVLSLNHAFQGNTLLQEQSGTSFAAPYITHLAGRLLNEYPQASANLLRAMLVNHANLPHECVSVFPEEWQVAYKSSTSTRHRELPREVAGYGKVDVDTLYRSTENEVVLLAEEQIENNAHQFFELPFPDDFLRSNRATRVIRITMAFSPPVKTTRLDYIATKLSFRLVNGESLEQVQRHFNHDMQDETDSMSESITGDRRQVSAQIREKGTVQSSIWTCRQLNPSVKWFVVITRQDRDWGEVLCSESEPYALVVTVSDHENEEARLYQQIQARIQEKAQTRTRL